MAGDPIDSPLACRNCGWQVDRNYCPNCGQHYGNHNNRLWPLIQEFLDEFLRFDSKLFRTLIPLVKHPGLLTRQWADGKRASYISPLKLYVTLSALFFLESSLMGHSEVPLIANNGVVHAQHHLDPTDFWVWGHQGPDLAKIDQRSLIDHFFMHLPAAGLLLVPLTALILSVLYARKKVNYVEHLVFILHYNSFCFLSLGVAALTNISLVSLIALVWPIVYLLIALKENYGQSWAKSTFKFVLFFFAYIPLLIFGLAGTAIVAATMASKIEPSSLSSSEMHHSHG